MTESRRVKLLRVPDAVQRKRKARSGAPLIRDRHGLERSRVCSAPFVSLMLRCARDTQIHTAALFLLAALRHAGTVRVDAGGTQSAGIRRKICWCRRADSNRQPSVFDAICGEGMQSGATGKPLWHKSFPQL
jgi:hypothetical protein